MCGGCLVVVVCCLLFVVCWYALRAAGWSVMLWCLVSLVVVWGSLYGVGCLLADECWYMMRVVGCCAVFVAVRCCLSGVVCCVL